ncbi:MAG: hypothetical protein EOP88_16225 [Verrucomicrobiaceae bacterium]|nr:MAG: hypothetical protein EOP88_16225 [Verrucomicrobiaceae bacterium]
MSLRQIAFALFLLIPTFISAQESDSDIQVELLAEQFPESLGQVCLHFEKEKSAAFDLPTNRLSNPVGATARTMVLKTVNKEIPLCTIKLPEKGKAFAIVLVTAKPSGFSPIIVRKDDAAFNAGDVFFINRSEKTILGKLGGTPLVLKPGESKTDRPSKPVDNTYYNIAFATRESNGEKLISSTRWPIDNHLRSYLFFFTNAQGKTTFRAVDEYLEKKAP